MDVNNQKDIEELWTEKKKIPAFKTANDFSLYIERLAKNQDMSYVEACIAFCEEHMLEPADIVNKVNQSLRQKLEQDFRDLNFLPKLPNLDD